jgi:hypothetical protein
MGLFILSIIICLLGFLSLLCKKILSFEKINIFTKEGLKKIYDNDYDSLKVIRKRGQTCRGEIFQEVPLEVEYHSFPWPAVVSDNIEIYGLKNDKELLIYDTVWSKDAVKKALEIINEYNNKTMRG